MEKKKNEEKIGWFTLSKLFWKEQIIFTLLCVISCLTNQFIDSNSISKFLGGSKDEIVWDIGVPIFGWKIQTVKYENPALAILIMIFAIIFYALIVFAHVYYSKWLTNKITVFLKRKACDKLYNLKNPKKEENESLAVFYKHIDNFSEQVFYAANQILYVALGSICTYCSIWRLTGYWWAPLLGIALVMVIIGFYYLFQKGAQKKESLFRTKYNKIIAKEDFLVKNNNLIIKKGLTGYYKKDYQIRMGKAYSVLNFKEIWTTAALVIPNFFISKIGLFFVSYFLEEKDQKQREALLKGMDLINAGKKLMERTMDFPIYLTAKKQINDFFAKEERNDIQKNVFINEAIEQINLEELGFFYYKNKWVFRNLRMIFKKGKINQITGKNGFGKSTIINLIFGLLQAQKGKIIINEKYNLKELNLINWREKIAYSEHENLLEAESLSTGQKQLKDIKEIFVNLDKKDIFIFDEADNALDKENKSKVYQEMEKLSKEKIVIYISH